MSLPSAHEVDRDQATPSTLSCTPGQALQTTLEDECVASVVQSFVMQALQVQSGHDGLDCKSPTAGNLIRSGTESGRTAERRPGIHCNIHCTVMTNHRAVAEQPREQAVSWSGVNETHTGAYT